MSHLLGTLLCVNNQFITSWSHRGQRPTPFPVRSGIAGWPGHGSPPRLVIPEDARPGPVGRPRRNRRSLLMGYCLAGVTTLAVAGFLLQFTVGMLQVDHTRERVRWSRQLLDREQEIRRLTREHQALQGMIAVRSMNLTKPGVPGASLAVTQGNPAPRKQPL
jgi:hypothetical protein